VDVTRDPNNCGTTGNRCADLEYCIGGFCVCRPGLTDVGGSCVDLQTDPANCGTIGNVCLPSFACAGGTCHALGCPAGLRNCGGACVNRDTDPNNCGGCGNLCNRDEVCVAGSCKQFVPGTGCSTCPCDSPACVGDFSQCCSYPGTTDVVCVDSGSCP
jgi:hypothetical protein